MKKRALSFCILVLFLIPFMSAAGNNSIESFFSTTNITCVRTATTAEWVDYLNPSNRINATNNCSLFVNNTLNIDACCPTSPSLSWCSSTGYCSDGSLIITCEGYKNENDCKNDFNNVGLKSVGNSSICGVSNVFNRGGNVCVNRSKCGCYWDSAHSVCLAKVKYDVDCYGSEIEDYGYCVWNSSVLEDHCNDSRNNRVIFSKAFWYPGKDGSSDAGKEDCKDITRVYPCIATAKLPFFTLINILVAIMVITIIYFVYSIKKKE